MLHFEGSFSSYSQVKHEIQIGNCLLTMAFRVECDIINARFSLLKPINYLIQLEVALILPQKRAKARFWILQDSFSGLSSVKLCNGSFWLICNFQWFSDDLLPAPSNSKRGELLIFEDANSSKALLIHQCSSLRISNLCPQDLVDCSCTPYWLVNNFKSLPILLQIP